MNTPTRRYRLYTGLGAILLAISVILDFTSSGAALTDGLMLALIAAGSVLLVTGIFLYQRHRPSATDERFVLHRLKSSRFGLIVGLAMILGLFLYHALMEDAPPWDLVAVAAAMAAGKLAAMAYFKVTG